MTENGHFLLIEAGDPFSQGHYLSLEEKSQIIGRPSLQETPDISFQNAYVSRKHAQFTWESGYFSLTDLNSRHGTFLNGQPLIPLQPYPLHHLDQITLVHDVVKIRYFAGSNPADSTIPLPAHITPPPKTNPLSVDIQRKEVRLSDSLLPLSGKVLDLLLYLYEQKNKAVSFEEIKVALWPERILQANGIPEVGNDEIIALVYRLRKKLGTFGSIIRTIPRYGLILDE